jgi:AcrR family transcriptional regulator
MSAEKLKTAVRQEQIAQAALHLIGRRGLKGLSVGGLARSVGLVPSAIYRHFPSKDHVIGLVLDLIRARLLENARAVNQETTDPLEALRLLLMRHVKLVRENEAIPLVIFSEQVYAGRPERRARMYQVFKEYLGSVRELIERGQRLGRIRTDLDSQALAVMFIGLFQPGAILWHLSEGEFDLTRQAVRAWRVYRDALEPSRRARASTK